MRYTKKVKGFTLSEMLVVLLITLIVVGLAFSVLRLVQKQMLIAQENYYVKSEVNLFRQSLNKDFNSFSRIFYDESEQKMTLVNELGVVSYVFGEEYIIKEIDSFEIQSQVGGFYFKGLRVNGSGEIDALELSIEEGKELLLFFQKGNAAETFMN